MRSVKGGEENIPGWLALVTVIKQDRKLKWRDILDFIFNSSFRFTTKEEDTKISHIPSVPHIHNLPYY